MQVLDSGIQNVTDALHETGMWEDTLLIFQADNGGWSLNPTLGGNNYPLRGGKVSDFEGGVRTTTFLNGGFLPSNLKGTHNSGLSHIADWYATFMSLAGIDAVETTLEPPGRNHHNETTDTKRHSDYNSECRCPPYRFNQPLAKHTRA